MDRGRTILNCEHACPGEECPSWRFCLADPKLKLLKKRKCDAVEDCRQCEDKCLEYFVFEVYQENLMD
jgi:hypothetical protein